MNTQRIEQHYQKLLARFPERDALTTLQELADTLYCSKRHMRTLIIHMQQAGWLSWNSKPGRGHKARLTLHYSAQTLTLEKAEKLLDNHDIHGVFAILGEDRQHLTRLLQSRMGHHVHEGRQSLRIPYYRTLHNLCPGTPLRRSEVHLVKQIFSGLTSIDETRGTVKKDLAHHWRRLSTLHWRFFLRPGVLFHDGTPLTSKDVVASLMRCTALPLFSHFRRIEAQGDLCISIDLHTADDALPLLLADAAALILPADHVQRANFAAFPVGTGPYQVTDNNEWHLMLTAYDRYFGFRSLLDDIEIITGLDTFSGNDARRPFALLSSSMRDLDYVAEHEARLPAPPNDRVLERGGYFLLCDSRSSLWRTPEQRRWIHHILSPAHLLSHMDNVIRPLWHPASSLLPDWSHAIESGLEQSPWHQHAEKYPQRLRLAFHRHHWEFPMLVEACREVLAAHHITLDAIELPYEAWARGEGEADIWLGTVNFRLPESWSVGAWLMGMPLLKLAVSGGDTDRFSHWQQQWRAGILSSQDLTAQIIRQGWLQPLFHHWMRLTGSEQAQGIHFNNLGWFDFTAIWIEPPETEK